MVSERAERRFDEFAVLTEGVYLVHGPDNIWVAIIRVSDDDPRIRDDAIEHLFVRVADGERIVRARERPLERDPQRVLNDGIFLNRGVAPVSQVKVNDPVAVQIYHQRKSLLFKKEKKKNDTYYLLIY